MDKNSENFSMEAVMKFAGTPAGKQLIALLQQADPATLQAAAMQAKRGDVDGAKKALSPLLSSEEVQKIIGQLGG